MGFSTIISVLHCSMLCAALATPQLLRSHAIQQHLSAATIQRDEAFGSLRDDPTNFKQLLKKMCDGGNFPTPKGCGSSTGSGFDKLYELFGLRYLDAVKYKASMLTTEDKWGAFHEFKDRRPTNALPDAPYEWQLGASTQHCIESLVMTVAFKPKEEDAEIPWEVVKQSNNAFALYDRMKVSPATRATGSKDKCASYIFAGYLKQSLSTLCSLGGTSATLYATRELLQEEADTGYYVLPRYGFDGPVPTKTLEAMLTYLKDISAKTRIDGAEVDPDKAYTWLKTQCGYAGAGCTKTVQLHTIFGPADFPKDDEDHIRNAVKAAWKAKGEDISVSFPLDKDSCSSPTAGTPAEVAWSLLKKAVDDHDKNAM
jgi:hypothetical protein